MFIEENVNEDNTVKNEKIDRVDDRDIRNGNNDINIDDIYTINSKSQIDEIWEIIDNLNNDTDLNFLIDSINKIRLRLKNKKIFDKNKMTISLNNKEVDKFSNDDKMHKNFSVDVNFQII